MYDYNARYYDPYLNRFISPDTIVPDPTNPQSLNRYSYGYNNPVKYLDPTGHVAEGADGTGDVDLTLELLNLRDVEDYYHYLNNSSNMNKLSKCTSTVIDFIPGLGDAKGFVEVFTGKDLITGDGLGVWRLAGLWGMSELRHLKNADEIADIIELVDNAGLIDPSTIRFAQDTATEVFKDGRRVQDLIDGLRSGLTTADDVSAIRVFKMREALWTLDNRRLFAFQQAQVPIRTIPATFGEIVDEIWKFTTKNDGLAVLLKGKK